MALTGLALVSKTRASLARAQEALPALRARLDNIHVYGQRFTGA